MTQVFFFRAFLTRLAGLFPAKRDIAESRLMRDFPVAGQEGGASPLFLLLRCSM